MAGDAVREQTVDDPTILVVESDPSVRALEVLILGDLEYPTCTAADGLEALTVLRAHPGQIPLVLADVDAPRLDGLELARRLAVETPNIRVILLCRWLDDLRGEPLPPNVRGVLPKPFELPALARMVREALAS
jgi:CheY-like chemotaxis protein